jgi:2'-5' RNA ligase
MEDRRLEMEVGGTRAAALRLFVAISLPDAVNDEIEKAQKEMRGALPGNFIRWTKREQFHLTLKFIGNMAGSRLAELSEALGTTCGQFAKLPLRTKGIGFFPDLRSPRVVWVGVRDEGNVLPRLQGAIETAVSSFATEKSGKQFTGHVTLGRIEGIRRPQAEILSKLARGMGERFFGEWVADRVELIRSELSSGGSRYTTLAAIPLSGAS